MDREIEEQKHLARIAEARQRWRGLMIIGIFMISFSTSWLVIDFLNYFRLHSKVTLICGIIQGVVLLPLIYMLYSAYRHWKIYQRLYSCTLRFFVALTDAERLQAHQDMKQVCDDMHRVFRLPKQQQQPNEKNE